MKITDITQIKIGTEIIDSDGQVCHVSGLSLKGSIKSNCVHQLLLFPLIGKQDDWYTEQETFIQEKMFTTPQEHGIRVQHYPNKKWYIADVKCVKCNGLTKLKFTSTSAEKFVCTHTIEVNENFYTCSGKKFEEITRRYTGISVNSSYSWVDFIKEFTI